MTSNNPKFKIILEAQDKVTQYINSISEKMSDLEKQSKNTFDSKAIKKMKQEMQQLSQQIKQAGQLYKTYSNIIKEMDKQSAQTSVNNIKIKKEQEKQLSQQKINDLKREREEEKNTHQQIMNALKEEEQARKNEYNERVRQEKEKARIARENAREQRRQNQELLRQDRERLQAWKEIGTQMKSVSSTMSNVGKAMIGTATAVSSGIISGASKLSDTFISVDRALAIKASSGDLGNTSLDQWNSLAMRASRKNGYDLSSVNDYLEMSINATTPYYAAKNLDTMTRLGYVTGTDGITLGTLNSLYGNRLNRYGWTDIEQFADAIIAMNDIGSATPNETVESFAKVLNATGKLDQYDKYNTMKLWSAINRNIPTQDGATITNTMIKQLVGSDLVKKDLGGVTRQLASAHGLTLQEYGKKYLGIDLKGNNLYSIEDLYKTNFPRLITGVFEDIMNMEGATFKTNKNSKGEVESVDLITSHEIQSDLLKEISRNANSLMGLWALVEAKNNGTLDLVDRTFTDENIKGRLTSSEKTLNDSDIGKLKKSLNSLSTNFIKILSRLAPLMSGFMDKVVQWTDRFSEMNFDELVKYGGELAETMKTLITVGVGLLIATKITSMFGSLITTTVNVINLMGKFGYNVDNLGYRFGRSISAMGTNLALGTNNTLSSFSVLAGAATTTAGKAAILGGELAILTGTVIWAYTMIKNMVSDFKEFGQSKEYLQGKEDAYNKKNTALSSAYNRTSGNQSTALTSFFGNLSDGKYLNAVGDLFASYLNFGGTVSSYINSYATTKGNTVMQDLWNTDNSQLSTPKKIFKYATIATNLGDYIVNQKNKNNVDKTYEENKGNYIEPGLANAKSYFDKTENAKNSFEDELNNILKELKQGNFTTNFNPDDNYDINELPGLSDLIEDSTEKGTKKGVESALSGHFNIPSTYNILGQVGLGQLNKYEDFAVSRQGDKTVINKNNINININGGDKQEIKNVLDEYFGQTGALAGATDFAF